MHISLFAFIVYKTPVSEWSPIQSVSSFFSKTFVGKPLTINTDVYVYSNTIQITKKMNLHNILFPQISIM